MLLRFRALLEGVRQWVLRDNIEQEDIIVVRKLLPKRSENELFFVPRSTASKRVNTLNPENKEKDEAHDHSKGAEHFDEKNAVLPSGIKGQSPFDETASSEWKKNEKIPVDYRGKKLKLQFMSASAYLPACMIPKPHYVRMLFPAADVKCLCSAVFNTATISNLLSPHLKAEILEVTAITESKSWH